MSEDMSRPRDQTKAFPQLVQGVGGPCDTDSYMGIHSVDLPERAMSLRIVERWVIED